MHQVIKLLDEFHCLQVLASPISVGYPFTRITRVVEVQHRGHRIHPQSIKVVFIEPEQGGSNEEVAHFVTTEVEDQGTPVLVFTQTRVFMFIERSAIKSCQTETILGEVRRHPVQIDANTLLMTIIDKVTEIIGSAETTGGGKIAHRLVAPGTIKGVFGHRQQLQMGKAQLLAMRYQSMRHLTIV